MCDQEYDKTTLITTFLMWMKLALFFKLTPDKTVKIFLWEIVKRRITVCVCRNMTGTEEKKTLTIIEKSRHPCYFKSIKTLQLTTNTAERLG